MEPNKQLIGIVIKRDGTVPFDDDCHPETRHHIMAHLIDAGHKIEVVPGTRHVRIIDYKPAE